MRFDKYFQERVKKTPSHQALFFQGAGQSLSLSYHDLDVETSKIASYLSHLGVREGTCVAVVCQRGPIYPLLFIACAKLGAIYVPLLVSAETEKTKQIITGADINYIVTDEKYHEIVNNLGCQHLLMKSELSSYHNNDYSEPEASNPILYLIYSSGTTSEPKGIPIAHEGMAYWGNVLESTIKQATPRILGNTSVGFDPHIWEYVMAWSTGGCLYLTDENAHRSSSVLASYIAKNEISDATFTPKLFSIFISSHDNLDRLYQNGLRRLYLTGEALSRGVLKKCDSSGIIVYNCYGPSELTFGFSIKEVHAANVDENDTVEIGFSNTPEVMAFLHKPTASVSAGRISGTIQLLTPLSEGEGELLVSSPYMAMSYYRNTILTNTRFFTANNNNKNYRLYPTEDIIQVNHGRLFYRGRLGDRVKRDLIFINLEEIRSLLGRYFNDDTVSYDAMVVGSEAKDYLFFYVSRPCDERAIREYILDNLSINEVPDYILSMVEFPCTANGKADKKTLRTIAEDYLCKITVNETSGFAIPRHISDFNEIKNLISLKVLMIMNQIEPGADIFFKDSNKLLCDYFSRSINWVSFTSKLNSYFKQSVTDVALLTLSFNRLILTIIRPYLLLISCEYVNKKDNQKSGYLFCIPPVTGDVNGYRGVVGSRTPSVLMIHPALNPDIYRNIQLNNLCAESFSDLTLVEMAQAYVDCIRIIQPQGPQQVVGWSFAGAVILAMLNSNLDLAPILIDAADPMYLQSLQRESLKEWLLQFGNYLLYQFRLQKGIYLTLPESISFDMPNVDGKALIEYFFNTLLSLISTSQHEAMIYFINMITITRYNMLSVYDFSSDYHSMRHVLKVYQSEHGLMGKQVCYIEKWREFVENISYKVITNTDHFTIIHSPDFISNLSNDLESLSQNVNSDYSELKQWHIPYLSPSTLARPDIFDNIVASFERQISQSSHAQTVLLVACSGLGGVGKTEMAKYFAITRQHYKYRVWFEAETTSKLFTDYQILGKYLRGRTESSPQELIGYIKHFFNTHTDWLIVYDNVEDPKKIEDYIPQKGGHILMTSRLSNLPNSVPVDVFNEDQAIQYFMKYCQVPIDDIIVLKDLIKALGALPLALAQACAYINSNKTYTIRKYYKEFIGNPQYYLSDTTMPLFNKHGPVALTWKITVDAIAKESEDAEFILNCLPYVYPVGIRIQYLSGVFKSNNEARTEKAINVLAKYSMVHVSDDREHISVHRLVQLVVWDDQKNKKNNIFYLQIVLETIIRNCTLYPDGLILAGVSLNKGCLADIIQSYENMLLSDSENTIILQALGCCYISSNLGKAEKCFKKVIDLSPHSSVYFEYGHALYINSRFREAKNFFKKSITCHDDKYSYFSEMEKEITDIRISQEISRVGIVCSRSKLLSYLYLIECYLKSELCNLDKANMYMIQLHTVLQKESDPFVQTFCDELALKISQRIPSKPEPKMGCIIS